MLHLHESYSFSSVLDEKTTHPWTPYTFLHSSCLSCLWHLMTSLDHSTTQEKGIPLLWCWWHPCCHFPHDLLCCHSGAHHPRPGACHAHFLCICSSFGGDSLCCKPPRAQVPLISILTLVITFNNVQGPSVKSVGYASNRTFIFPDSLDAFRRADIHRVILHVLWSHSPAPSSFPFYLPRPPPYPLTHRTPNPEQLLLSAWRAHCPAVHSACSIICVWRHPRMGFFILIMFALPKRHSII